MLRMTRKENVLLPNILERASVHCMPLATFLATLGHHQQFDIHYPPTGMWSWIGAQLKANLFTLDGETNGIL